MSFKVSFCFDDANVSAMDWAYPAFSKAGVTGTVAPCVAWLDHGKRLSTERLLGLQSEGWEIASHSLNHRRLTELPLRIEDEPIELFQSTVTDGCRVVEYAGEKVAGVLENGIPLLRQNDLDGGVQRGAFAHDPERSLLYIGSNESAGSELRIISAEREILESADALEARGFRIQTFIPPNNEWSPELRRIASRRYSYVAAGPSNNNIAKSINLPDGRNPLFLRRWPLRLDRPAAHYIERLERCLDEPDARVIFCVHGLLADDSDDKIYFHYKGSEFLKILDWLLENGVEIAPISSALR